jgi:3-dehydroquinate dehydratase type I
VTQKICVSILPKNIADALDLIGRAEAEGADFIEVRMDCLEETRNLQDLPKSTKIPLIAANKLQCEHGFFDGSQTERVQTLLNAAKSGFSYVDVDYTSPNPAETVKKLKAAGAKVVVSYHKFDGILPIPSLEKILDDQIGIGADICKIVLTANYIEDNLPILSFVSFASAKAKLVCFCMGEAGKTSRLLSPTLGAYFSFAALEGGKQTAAGQMTLKEMRTAYKLLGIL